MSFFLLLGLLLDADALDSLAHLVAVTHLLLISCIGLCIRLLILGRHELTRRI